MRYIRSPNEFQLRLGWIRVIASLVGTTRLGRTELRDILIKRFVLEAHAQRTQSTWIAEADLETPPSGLLSKRAAQDIVSMAITYGVYDADARGLTDWGYVLRQVAPWDEHSSPFIWTDEGRLIGLRLIIATYGDVCIELLSHWPKSPGGIVQMNHLRAAMDALAEKARTDDDRVAFSRQTRFRDDEAKAWTYILRPYLEPLRELGYLRREQRYGYVLTTRGESLRNALSGVTSADDLLNTSLVRSFMAGEGSPYIPAVNAGEHLRVQLMRLPPELTGAACEAPLAPVTLLMQATLLACEPPQAVELAGMQALLQALGNRSGGRVGLKAGTDVASVNVTWTAPENLGHVELWELGETSPPGGAEEPPSPPPADTEERSTSEQERGLKLWFHYLGALLAPRALGSGSVTWLGGPWMWHRALGECLDLAPHLIEDRRRAGAAAFRPGKSSVEKWPLITTQVSSWLQRVGHDVPCPCLRRLVRVWPLEPDAAAKCDTPQLRGALLRFTEELSTLRKWSVHAIEFFLVSGASSAAPDAKWRDAAGATFILVEDAIHRGWHARGELRARLPSFAARGLRGARDFLTLLHAPGERSTYICEVEFRVPAGVGDLLERLSERVLKFAGGDGFDDTWRTSIDLTLLSETDTSIRPDQKMILATVELQTRTPSQARTCGLEFALEALSRLSFLAAVVDPAGSPCAPLVGTSLGAIRLASAVGDPIESVDCEEEALVPSSDSLGFSTRREREPLERILTRLPTLASIGRSHVQDARMRMSMALHWLAVADDPHLRPSARIYHAWVAIEHLVAHGHTSKGPEVIPSMSNMIVLRYMNAFVADMHREILASVHCEACNRPGDTAVLDVVELWMGPEERSQYAARVPGPPVGRLQSGFDPVTPSRSESIKAIFRRRMDLSKTAETIRLERPWLAFRVEEFGRVLAKIEDLIGWLRQRRLEIASILQTAYSLRNRLLHDADPLGFDESPAVADFYEQLRALVQPAIEALLHEVQRTPALSVAQLLTQSEARLEEIFDLGGKNAPADGMQLVSGILIGDPG